MRRSQEPLPPPPCPRRRRADTPPPAAAVPDSLARLQPLKQLHVQQLEGQGERAAKIDALLSAYNTFVMDVSAKCVGIDAALAKHGH